MASLTILEALDTLCKCIPEWNARLEELNGQIALRQADLARLSLKEQRPSTRSLRNKGSTESLRPRDEPENPFLTNDPEDIALNPFNTPTSNKTDIGTGNGIAPPRGRTSPRGDSTHTGTSPPPPRSMPPALIRQASQPEPVTASPATVLRKRKTESLASNESQAPKYRTRSMIIVYYDSYVQQGFEDLVKLISGSRNAMRKGKMAAKMEKMKRAAELEALDNGDEKADHKEGNGTTTPVQNKSLAVKPNSVSATSPEHAAATGPILAATDDPEDGEMPIPKLTFKSTRQMGPSRDSPKTLQHMRAGDVFRSYRRTGSHAEPDIFDELDKGLEWSQGQCEHGAHQFLRSGETSAEVASVKERLLEVKEKAEREMVKLRKEESQIQIQTQTPSRTIEKYRKTPTKEIPSLEPATTQFLEVDDELEVDEDEHEMPMVLDFKRSRDIAF